MHPLYFNVLAAKPMQSHAFRINRIRFKRKTIERWESTMP
jgi:hypothetical protein